MQTDALKTTIRQMMTLFTRGLTDDEIMADLANRTGKPAEQFRAVVVRARRGYEQGRENAIRKSVSAGIESAFQRFRANRPQPVSRRLGLRITAVVVGCFLAIVAIGGFAEGEPLPASMVAVLAATSCSLFFVLQPKKNRPNVESTD